MEVSVQTHTMGIARHAIYVHPTDSSIVWCAMYDGRLKLLILQTGVQVTTEQINHQSLVATFNHRAHTHTHTHTRDHSLRVQLSKRYGWRTIVLSDVVGLVSSRIHDDTQWNAPQYDNLYAKPRLQQTCCWVSINWIGAVPHDCVRLRHAEKGGGAEWGSLFDVHVGVGTIDGCFMEKTCLISTPHNLF